MTTKKKIPKARRFKISGNFPRNEKRRRVFHVPVSICAAYLYNFSKLLRESHRRNEEECEWSSSSRIKLLTIESMQIRSTIAMALTTMIMTTIIHRAQVDYVFSPEFCRRRNASNHVLSIPLFTFLLILNDVFNRSAIYCFKLRMRWHGYG